MYDSIRTILFVFVILVTFQSIMICVLSPTLIKIHVKSRITNIYRQYFRNHPVSYSRQHFISNNGVERKGDGTESQYLQSLAKYVNNFTERHPIYKKLGITGRSKVKRVDILIIVTSAPGHSNRRNAIRNTWWKQCIKTRGIIPECIFTTDHQSHDSMYYNITKDEALRYGDLKFQNLRGGVEFGARFLYHLVYAVKNYDFDYLLRMDDDFFFCLCNFIYELPEEPLTNLHWGHVHCLPNITRPEESMILFSYDVIRTFLTQNPLRMKCHPFADQMIAIWLTELNTSHILRHDFRIHHHPIVKYVPGLRFTNNICSKYIAIHGSYAKDTEWFWRIRGPVISQYTGNIYEKSLKCDLHFSFDWKKLGEFSYEPKLCIDNPKWKLEQHVVKNGQYIGREEED